MGLSTTVEFTTTFLLLIIIIKLLTLPNTGAPAPKNANGTSELSFGVNAVSVFDA